MTQDTRELLERALLLPRDARAELVHRLIESLDSGEDDSADVERAWGDEIGRRVRRVLQTGDRGTSLDEVVAEARALLARDRAARKAP